MNLSIICWVILLSLNFKSCFILGYNVGSCIVANKASDVLLQRVDPLIGRKFSAVKDNFNYVVSICGGVTSELVNVSATQELKDKAPVVLGRLNDTGIVAGSSWVLLTYGSGDQIKEPCEGPAQVEVVITCADVSKATLSLRDILKQHGGSNGCFFMFDLVVPSYQNCSSTEEPTQPKDEGLSNGSVFCIIFLTSFGVYLAIGIFYRRLVKGAKGFEQIPHADFWRKLGNLQADGCDFVCRRGDRREESWQRLTNNFNDSQDDRDDALLRP